MASFTFVYQKAKMEGRAFTKPFGPFVPRLVPSGPFVPRVVPFTPNWNAEASSPLLSSTSLSSLSLKAKALHGTAGTAPLPGSFTFQHLFAALPALHGPLLSPSAVTPPTVTALSSPSVVSPTFRHLPAALHGPLLSPSSAVTPPTVTALSSPSLVSLTFRHLPAALPALPAAAGGSAGAAAATGRLAGWLALLAVSDFSLWSGTSAW